MADHADSRESDDDRLRRLIPTLPSHRADTNGFPASCSACGLTFTAPNVLIGGTGSAEHIRLTDIGVVCPRCGGAAFIEDGSYTYRDGVIRRLETVLDRARDERWSADRLADEIDAIEPRLARFATWCRENPAQAAMLVSIPTLFVSLMMFLLTLYNTTKGDAQPQPDITVIVEQTIINGQVPTSLPPHAPRRR